MGRPCSPGPLPLRIHHAGSPPPLPRPRSLRLQSEAPAWWFPGREAGRERASAASSVGRGQRCQPATLDRVGASPPRRTCLTYRATVLKTPLPHRGGGWAWGSPGGWGAKIGRCWAGTAGGGGWVGGWGLAPPAPARRLPPPRAPLPPPRRSPVRQAVGTAGQEALGAGATLTPPPPAGIPLSFGAPLDFRGAGSFLWLGRLCPRNQATLLLQRFSAGRVGFLPETCGVGGVRRGVPRPPPEPPNCAHLKQRNAPSTSPFNIYIQADNNWKLIV